MIKYVLFEHLHHIKNMAAEKKMYDLFLRLQRVEDYFKKLNDTDIISQNEFVLVLQDSIIGLSDDQLLLVKPIIREIKLKQIL